MQRLQNVSALRHISTEKSIVRSNLFYSGLLQLPRGLLALLSAKLVQPNEA